MIELNIIGLIGSILLWGVTLYFIGYNRDKRELEIRWHNNYNDLLELKEKLIRAEYSEKYQINEKNHIKYILDHLHDDDTAIISNDDYRLYMVRRDAVDAMDNHEEEYIKLYGG